MHIPFFGRSALSASRMKSSTFYLFVEPLEERQLLAGDVSVSLLGDQLLVEGDGSSNRIEIVSDGNTITIQGQGTDLNGSRGVLTFSVSTIGNYSIDLGSGNNRLTMIAGNVPTAGADIGFGASLEIITGNGNDRISLIASNSDGVGFFAETSVDTGNGNDRVLLLAENTIGAGFAAETISVVTGGGNDRIDFEATNSGSFGYFLTNLLVDSGAGNDRVSFVAKNIEHSADGNSTGFRIGDSAFPGGIFSDLWIVQTGDGDDRLTIEANNDFYSMGFDTVNVGFGMGQGRDRVNLEANNRGDIGMKASVAIVSTDGGDDRVAVIAKSSGDMFVSGFLFEEELGIVTGDGRDRIELTSQNDGGTGIRVGSSIPTLESLKIETGEDDDRVTIRTRTRGGAGARGIIANQLEYFAGNGNDRIQIRSHRNLANLGLVVSLGTNVRMGDGHDQARLQSSGMYGLNFGGPILFDGGVGDNDRLQVDGDLFISPSAHINFEQVM